MLQQLDYRPFLISPNGSIVSVIRVGAFPGVKKLSHIIKSSLHRKLLGNNLVTSMQKHINQYHVSRSNLNKNT